MIIGLTGTFGAGKGTVAEYLTKNKKFVYFSVRNFLAAEVLKEGKMVSRETLAKIGIELKALHGADYIVKALMEQAKNEKHNIVIESLRSPEEALYLKSHGAKLWAVDADPKVRYARTTVGKKGPELISLEQFVAQENKELESTETSKENLAEAIHMADETILNSGTKEELYQAIDAALAKDGISAI